MIKSPSAGEAGNGESTGSALPHRAYVEEVLGVPLLPQGVPYNVTADPEQPDIRVKVHNVVVEATGGAGSRAAVSKEIGGLLVQARRHVVIANNVAESVSRPAFVPPGADTPDTPRALLQTRMGKALYDFIQRPHPSRIPGANNGLLAPLQSGLIIVSATATGKTVPMAELIQRAGVGRPFAENDQDINSALIVVPSVRLLKQYMDPDETLRRWLPDVEFSDYWHGAHNADGAVKIVLKDSLDRGMASGAFKLSSCILRAVDEGHRAGSPRMLGRLGKMAGGMLILCTATPREMRRYFVDFTASTPRSAAEDGITRPVQLFTYLHSPEEGDAERKTARIAAEVIKSGRQVGIYCRPIRGRPDAQQARDVVALINATLQAELGEPDKEYAKVIADFMGDEANTQAEADFRAGKIKAYAAISMLGEGVNVPMDALIVIGGRRASAQWQLDQIAGRLPRPIFGSHDHGKAGLLMEVQPNVVSHDEPLASIWRTYGFEDTDIINQGHFVGPDDMKEFAESDNPPARRQRRSPTRQDLGAQNPDINRPAVFKDLELLDGYLAPPGPLRAITIAPEQWDRYEKPTEGSRALSVLAQKFNVPEVWLRRRLDELSRREDLTIQKEVDSQNITVPIQITYVGVRSKDEEIGTWDYARWYGPDTVAYLEQNPPVELASGELMSGPDIAEMCGTYQSHVATVIGKLNKQEGSLPFEERLGKNHRPTKHYRMPEILKIAQEIEATPVADPDKEEALFDVAQELGENFVYAFARVKKNRITVNDRRRHPSSGLRGFARHVSKEDAARMRQAYYDPPIATSDKISVADVAQRAGISLSGALKKLERMPEEEQPDIEYLKRKPKGRMSAHVDREVGLALAEMWRVRKLLPHRVTLGMLAKYFKADRKTVTVRIATLVKRNLLPPAEAEPESINLGGQGGEVSAWPWRVMQTLETHGEFDMSHQQERVDYDLVARGPYDSSWQYSQQVQARLGDPDKLAQLPARNKLRLDGGRHRAPAGSLVLDEYVASRQLHKDEVLEAIATDTVPDILLYYRDSHDPGNPTYIIDKDDVIRLDKHFNTAPVKAAPEPAPVVGLASKEKLPVRAVAGPAELLATPEPPAPRMQPAPAAVPPVKESRELPNVRPTSGSESVPTEQPLAQFTEHWLPDNEVLARLKCTPVALSYLVTQNRDYRQNIRKTEEGLVLHKLFVLTIEARCKRLTLAEDGWIYHHRLASHLKMTNEGLRQFIRSVGQGQGEAKVARVYGATNIEYDVAYAPSLRKRILMAARNARIIE